MDFEIYGNISSIEIIAVNLSIRELKALKAKFGGERWRKLKGIATVRLLDGSICQAELHWYEAHGIGKRKIKIKRIFN